MDEAWAEVKRLLDLAVRDERPLERWDVVPESLMKKALRYVIDQLRPQIGDLDFSQPEDIEAMDDEAAWESMDGIFKRATEKREETEVTTKEQEVESLSSEESKKSGEGSAGSVEADRDRDREHG